MSSALETHIEAQRQHRCVHCGAAVRDLVKDFGRGAFRLTDCAYCKKVADPYIEVDLTFKFIGTYDLIDLPIYNFIYLFKSIYKSLNIYPSLFTCFYTYSSLFITLNLYPSLFTYFIFIHRRFATERVCLSSYII